MNIDPPAALFPDTGRLIAFADALETKTAFMADVVAVQEGSALVNGIAAAVAGAGLALAAATEKGLSQEAAAKFILAMFKSALEDMAEVDSLG